MTRWRVDFPVKSDLVLKKAEPKVVFVSPDTTHEIHLFTKRGEGKHAADELFLSAHVLLEDADPQQAGERAEEYLRQFLEVLSIVTSSYFSMKQKTLVADWSPGLNMRKLWYYNIFPNPHVPMYAIGQKEIDSAKILMNGRVPSAITMALKWWRLGASAGSPEEQFQYFWFALEILAEHGKPTDKVASKCQVCQDDLYCRQCNKVPVHRPYPKQAIKLLINKHVTGEPDRFFALVDEARNRLLHGDDPDVIERELNVPWKHLSDGLGKATYASLISTLLNNSAANASEKREISLIHTNTFTHYDVIVAIEGAMGCSHADPANPQIEEFDPKLDVKMLVGEHPNPQQANSDQGPVEASL